MSMHLSDSSAQNPDPKHSLSFQNLKQIRAYQVVGTAKHRLRAVVRLGRASEWFLALRLAKRVFSPMATFTR
jgi:hypothetical protein